MTDTKRPSAAPNTSLTRTRVYDQEYFSSSQVNLYIGDVLIDEATSLQLMVQQNQRPVYGYASQLFDATTRGTVLVQGEFTINFKESAYLHTVLSRFKKQTNGLGPLAVSPYVSRKNVGRDKGGGAKLNGVPGFLARQNVEQILEGDVNKESLIDYYQSLAGFSNARAEESAVLRYLNIEDNRKALETAEGIFEAFEDKVWGANPLDTTPRRVDDNFFDDFTMWITYGDYNSNDYVNHTARRVDGVRLTGQSQVITDRDGSPIQERYTFIARNWV